MRPLLKKSLKRHKKVSTPFIVSIKDILDENTGNAILVLSNNEYAIRKKMMECPRIGDIDYIENLRGELDITLNRKSIVESRTPFRFYRGRNIGFYNIVDGENIEYVSDDFVGNTAKQRYIYETRLVCQQVVNIAKKKRISFTLVPENSVLGNSCNFISIKPNNEGIDNYFLLGILNSTLIEWFFKLTSSNNHINNYEIDNFPIPTSYAKKHIISNLVQEYIKTKQPDILTKIDALVYEAYGIVEGRDTSMEKAPVEHEGKSVFENKEAVYKAFYNDIKSMVNTASYDDCAAILEGKSSIIELCFQKNPTASKFERTVLQCIEKKYKKIYANGILNHTTFKLSELDLEMIRNVPQGGSWKDISLETVQKSKRLTSIITACLLSQERINTFFKLSAFFHYII